MHTAPVPGELLLLVQLAHPWCMAAIGLSLVCNCFISLKYQMRPGCRHHKAQARLKLAFRAPLQSRRPDGSRSTYPLRLGMRTHPAVSAEHTRVPVAGQAGAQRCGNLLGCCLRLLLRSSLPSSRSAMFPPTLYLWAPGP
jgi:hypothetical protein